MKKKKAEAPLACILRINQPNQISRTIRSTELKASVEE